jgi:hypothetical protein
VDGEEITSLPSYSVNGGGGDSIKTFATYRDMFEEYFADYLVMGMSYDEFYNGDPNLVRAYRKAYKTKLQNRNIEMWLQGAYVYEAVSRITPLMHAFAKNPKPVPYLTEPFNIGADEEGKESKKNKAGTDAALDYMKGLMTLVNTRFGG